jgi:DNA-binding transcriptional regulator YiaG
MTNAHDDPYSEVLQQLLELPPGSERDRLLESLHAETPGSAFRDMYLDAKRVLSAADALWADGHRAPTLEDDPIAAVLGLVPDDNLLLDPRALKRAREAARLRPTAFAEALNQRGWKVSTRDVFDWEVKAVSPAPPALVRAAAEVLRVDPDRVTRHTPQDAATKAPEVVRVANEVADSPRFAELVARFAKLEGMSARMAHSALRARVVATVHRGDHPDADQMLVSLEVLIQALEDADSD